MFRISKSFEARWGEERFQEALASIVLQPRLRALVDSPLAWRGGSLVMESLATLGNGPEAFPDHTGYEAFINKVHIEDFIEGGEQLELLTRQATKAAVDLSLRLPSDRSFRVLLSIDPELPTATMRFFERRVGEPWGADDPDAFPLEEILIIDTGS